MPKKKQYTRMTGKRTSSGTVFKGRKNYKPTKPTQAYFYAPVKNLAPGTPLSSGFKWVGDKIVRT